MNITGFLLASVLLTLMPGPDILFVITQSILQGRKAGVVFALGLCTGLIFHTMAATFGLALVLRKSETVLYIIQYAGAAYLIYLGVMSFINRKKTIGNNSENKIIKYRKLYLKGIIMNVLNPKVTLFFLAFLPQFVESNAENIALKMLSLSLIFILQAIIIFSIVAFIAGKISELFINNTKVNIALNYFQSFLFVAIGLNLFFNKLI